ncbi:hypothetical protein PCANC_14756 [Puccinia coronata f. sp. avenae]|uniref:Retrotransposon gag domain-containing protein n=1 Tax=Puccinia coronata f. sp. avenae TaxID=200324 RepID=A0A2N5SIM3_9BASI|nr:hypothetical protein PCANC_14756 [Puccinia coronata f. sp. avenae]
MQETSERMKVQQDKMNQFEDSLKEMHDMMAMFLEQSKSPKDVPLPETPLQKGRTPRFTTSTPFTGRTTGLDTTIQDDEESLIDSSEEEEPQPTRNRSYRKLPDEEKGVVLDTKKLNVEFDGSKVELFIKRVEKIAILQKAGGRDVALQLPFMIKDRKISECIEYMEGHENCDWELLKKELISKWGRATPKRRFDESSVSNLVSKYSDKGGIQTKEEYRTFIGELEEILAYLTRMEYEDINAESREPLWRAIALEIRREIARDPAHDKKLKKTKDGKALVPKLAQLKDYVEASLSVLDLEVGGKSMKKLSKAPEFKKALQKGLYRLQPPAVTLARGDRCYIGRPDRFYVGRAHRYIRTKA